MHINNISDKFVSATFNKIITRLYLKFRIFKFSLLSNCSKVFGKPNRTTPLLTIGLGEIHFGSNVNLGVYGSPRFFNSYIYIEARNIASKISFGSNVFINNDCCFISEGAGIIVGNDVLIGHNFCVYDSDFHELDPRRRISGKHKTKRVFIHDNVFIGSNVTVLKGVEIGRNSVIASGSVVTKSIDANVVAGGNPCKVLKRLDEQF